MNLKIALLGISALILTAPAAVRAGDDSSNTPSLSGEMNSLKNNVGSTAQGMKDNATTAGTGVVNNAKNTVAAKKKALADKKAKGETVAQRKARMQKAAQDKAAQGTQKANDTVNGAAGALNGAINKAAGQ